MQTLQDTTPHFCVSSLKKRENGNQLQNSQILISITLKMLPIEAWLLGGNPR